MQDDMIKMFKKNVPRQKKVYQTYMKTCKIQNFSYANFKNNNVALIEIKEYLMTLEEYYYLSSTQIDNMFEYLKQNISIDNFSKINKIYKNLNELLDFLNERYTSRNSLHGDDSKQNCLYIIDKIVQLKSDLASKKGHNVLEIENTIQFETVVKQILNPKEFDFNEEKLLYLIEKFPFLLNRDRNNKNFNDNFCRCIEKAKINRDRKKLNYYKNLYSYLCTIKELNLNIEYINYLFDISLKSVDSRIIERKIDSMRIDAKTGNRLVEDYIISIDCDITRKMDDAFSIEKVNDNYLLGIHIADVYALGYFEEDSMEVNIKSNVKKADASLTKNKKRNAMTMYILIDSNGIIRKCKMLNTVLKADANLVYEDIPHLIRSEGTNPELKKTVINLLSVYNLVENSKFPNNPTISNLAYLITSKLMMLCCTLYSVEVLHKDGMHAIFSCGDNKNSYYSIDSHEYYTGFDKYNTYAKITSPMYDPVSLMNQFIFNRYMLRKRYLNEEEEKAVCLKLKPIVDRLNKNKDIETF